MSDSILFQAHSDAWAKFNRIYPRLNKFTMPSVKFNNRFSSTAGMCYYTENRIEISYKLYVKDSNEILKVVVPHEIAHQVSWNLYQESGHGKAWKEIMLNYGLPPDRCHNIGVEPQVIVPNTTGYIVGETVSFEHRDRSRKVTKHVGHITKVNLKTIKVHVPGTTGEWTVYLTCPTLKKV